MSTEVTPDASPPSGTVKVDGIAFTVTKTAPWRYDVHRSGQRLGEFAWMPKAGISLVIDDGPMVHLQLAAQAFVEQAEEVAAQCEMAADMNAKLSAAAKRHPKTTL